MVSVGTAARPTLAVWKFSSCDGCQLSLLDCEDELLAVAEQVRDRVLPGSHPGDRRRTVRPVPRRGLGHHRPRRRAHPGDPRRLAPTRDDRRLRDGRRDPGAAQPRRRRRVSCTLVYATPRYVSTLATSTPISAHVPVDFELRGCPIDRRQLLDVIAAFLGERRPNVAGHSVCVECKLRGNVCVMVADGTPCLGPVTHAGCGALCPTYHRGCYGCFGPAEDPNPASLSVAARPARASIGSTWCACCARSTRPPRRSATRASASTRGPT